MAQMSDLDDLGSFLDFGDIDLANLPNVDDTQYGDHMPQSQHISHPNTPFNDISSAPLPRGTLMQDFGGQEQFDIPYNVDHHQHQYSGQTPTSHPFTTEPMYQPSMQQVYNQSHLQQYQFQPQPGFPPGYQVPPTPNSFEMHGEAGHFMQHQQQLDSQQRALLEQRYGVGKDDAIAFTPLASPAGTPQYNVQPEFTVPGAYFSPLTSPMLHAENSQNAHQHKRYHHGYYTNPSTAPSSGATSPVDPNIDIDMIGDNMSVLGPAAVPPKKPKRKVATPRSVVASARLRQSPIQKPQKRKSGTLASVVTLRDGLRNDAQGAGKLQPGSAGLQMPAVFNGSSEDSSTSPEALSEALMGPPPRPGSSLTQSPALAGQQEDRRAAAPGSAATPKSLLSKSGDQQPIDGSAPRTRTSQELGALEDLQLPEAAADQASRRPSLFQLNTKALPASSNEHTPRVSARKTPKLGPLSTPSSARPPSSMATPSGLGSPMTASTPGALLKDKSSDTKGGRGNNKRGSGANSSQLLSPALRPRISPSIKPLLPEGSKYSPLRALTTADKTPAALHSPTHALLLASKSNYQNLLEGNHLPGVNYPDSLSTGLTSKRTSHKVAEQGRRNRINDALKEMESLVPKQPPSKTGKDNSNSDESPEVGAGADGDTKESKEEATMKSNSSKAATVESANIYIRDMQEKDKVLEAELARLRMENVELAKRLAELDAAKGSTEEGAAAVDSASLASPKA